MIPIAKPQIGEEEKNAVLKVLSSSHLTQGEVVEKFEKNFSKFIGSKYAIALNSGTAALCLSLSSLGIKNGDVVITTPFSFIASANSILYCNAKPVFVDIDSRTFNIDPKKIEDKITDKTKAILVVHLYGQPCDMDSILKIVKEHDLYLIEDACQAHGAEYKGKKVGTFGDMACFSFYSTKNITTGEGGMVTTNDGKISEKIKLLRNHGQIKRYYHQLLGFNFRMTDIVAAIGIEQLKKLNIINRKRINNANFLTENLSDIKQIIPPFILPNVKHVFHQYTIRVTSNSNISREKIIKKLEERGVGTKIYYPLPIHKQTLYKKMGYEDYLPVSENISREVLSLPVHPSLNEEDLEFMVKSIHEILR